MLFLAQLWFYFIENSYFTQVFFAILQKKINLSFKILIWECTNVLYVIWKEIKIRYLLSGIPVLYQIFQYLECKQRKLNINDDGILLKTISFASFLYFNVELYN